MSSTITHTKPATGPIVLSCPIADAERTRAYITKSLELVELRGPVWDLPAEILVRFPGESRNARPRQAWALSISLFERVLRNVASVESAWSCGDRGTLTPADYTLMQIRTAAIIEAFERLPQFELVSHADELGTTAKNDASV